MPSSLARHELSVARRFSRLYTGRGARARLLQWLTSPLGNYAVNTPVYLLPGLVNLQPKHRVLEVGCAQAANLRFLTARIAFRETAVGLDLCRAALCRGERARQGRGYTLVEGTVSHLPFAGESFDLVIAAHVVRHLADEGVLRLLVEAERVLRPGGVLALWEFVPAGSAWRNRLSRWLLDALGGAGRLRRFRRLAHYAEDAGYAVVEAPLLRPFLFPPVPRAALFVKKAAPDPGRPA